MKYSQKTTISLLLFLMHIMHSNYRGLNQEERKAQLALIKEKIDTEKAKKLLKEQENKLKQQLNDLKNNSQNIITLRKTSKEEPKENISTIINLPHCTINNNPNSQSSLQSLDEEIQQPKTLFSQVKHLLCCTWCFKK